MKKIYLLFGFIVFFAYGNFAIGAENEETAKSWQQQAQSTRTAVVSVAEELGKIGDKGNPTAKDLITDAKMWLAEGDKELKKGDDAMAKGEWEKANYGYNMAWQYYVKAATAGLNAKRILTGQ